MTEHETPTGRAGQLRLSLLTALDAALHRRDEVSDAIAGAADRDDAVAAVRRLLGVGLMPANAVLTMTWDRMTAAGVRSIVDEVSNQATAIGVVVPPHAVWTAPSTFDDDAL